MSRISEISFWDIGKKSVQLLLFYTVFSVEKFSITLQQDILMGFASKWSIWEVAYETKNWNSNFSTIDSFPFWSRHICWWWWWHSLLVVEKFLRSVRMLRVALHCMSSLIHPSIATLLMNYVFAIRLFRTVSLFRKQWCVIVPATIRKDWDVAFQTTANQHKKGTTKVQLNFKPVLHDVDDTR